jgi:WD40 repeat protein
MWYYARGRERVGPLPWQELCQLAQQGQLTSADMVRPASENRWCAAGEVTGLIIEIPTVLRVDEPASAPTLPTLADTATPAPVESGDMQPMLQAVALGQSPPPRSDDTPTGMPALQNGDEIPGYTGLVEIGRGGMGVVYQAQQVGLHRTVALKTVLAGAHASSAHIRRFRLEAEAVARLQHPNIVQIHEIGEHNGLPYFCLEYVDGGSLAQKLRGLPQPAYASARMVATLARALHAAHQHGIIHRDLKPANVLLTADGTPKVTDFGLAKILDDEAGNTASSTVLGTPSYMAPEQALGRVAELGPLCDVYALGAILYEMLTGRPPFRGETPMETMLLVSSEEPIAPSLLQRKVPRDLETICLKCLEKDKRRRYISAAELAEDLRRFVDGEPIRARPVGAGLRFYKWARRRPAVAALILVSLTAAFTLVVGTLSFTLALQQKTAVAEKARDDAIDQEKETEKERDRAKAQEEIAKGERARAERERDNARMEKDRADENLRAAEQNLYTAQLARASSLLLAHEPEQALEQLHNTEGCPIDRRDFTWGVLTRLCRLELARGEVPVLKHPAAVSAIAISPDGKTLASGDDKGAIRLWDIFTGREIGAVTGHTARIRSIAFHPKGKSLVVSSVDQTVRLWDLDPARERWSRPMFTVDQVAFNRTGDRIVMTSIRGFTLVDAATGVEQAVRQHNNGGVRSVLFTHDGSTIIYGGDMGIILYDVDSKRERVLPEGQKIHVVDLAFSPDRKTLAAADTHGLVKLWELPDGRERILHAGHAKPLRRVAFSPDGKTLATAAEDGRVKLWNVATGHEQGTLVHHPPTPMVKSPVTGLAFTPNGQLLASSGEDGCIRLWQTDDSPEFAALKRHNGMVLALAFSPDNNMLASGSTDMTIKLWNLTNGREMASLQVPRGPVTWVAFTPDSATVLYAADDTIRAWDIVGRRERFALVANKVLNHAVALSPDGTMIATGANDNGDIVLWDATTGERRRVLSGHKGVIHALAFDPTSRIIASGGIDRIVRVWDVADGKLRAAFPGHGFAIERLTFSPDGATLVSVGNDKTARIWEGERGALRATMTNTVNFAGVVFTPDGNTLFAAVRNGLLLRCNAANGQEQERLTGPQRTGCNAVAMNGDGTTLATGGIDHTVRLWRVSSLVRAPVLELVGPGPGHLPLVEGGLGLRPQADVPGGVENARRAALHLKGGDHIELTNTAGLLDINGAFTVEMFFRLPEAAGNLRMIGDEIRPRPGREKEQAGWYLGMSPQSLPPDRRVCRLTTELFYADKFMAGIAGPGRNELTTGDWHHLAYVKTATQVRCYVDGRDFWVVPVVINKRLKPSLLNLIIGGSERLTTDMSLRGLRISRTARYPGNFTPPKAFARDKNTLILLDFTGAGDTLPDLAGEHAGKVVGGQWLE